GEEREAPRHPPAVEEEKVGPDGTRHGEAEAGVHARRVALHRRVEEVLELRERHDRVELGADLGAAHAKDRAVEVDVLPPGQIGVEAGADLDQRRQPALDRQLPPRGHEDPAQVLEQRALAGAVVADDAERLPFVDAEADVAQGPELLAPERAGDRALDERGDEIAQRVVDLPLLELLVQALRLEDDVAHHTLSANFGSRRWNTAGATRRSAAAQPALYSVQPASGDRPPATHAASPSRIGATGLSRSTLPHLPNSAASYHTHVNNI